MQNIDERPLHDASPPHTDLALDDEHDEFARLDDKDKEKRIRRRFTTAQLTLLEQLYHRSSHPTREQREEVSNHGNMELRSVTIWFQNKRQTERKFALSITNAPDAPSPSSTHSDPVPPPSRPTKPRTRQRDREEALNANAPSRALGRTLSVPIIGSTSRARNAPLARSASSSLVLGPSGRRRASLPSLSRNVSRTGTKLVHRPTMDNVLERPAQAASTTPPRRRSASPRRIYDVMPSSPTRKTPAPAAPQSPEAQRGFVEYGRRLKRAPTLEWACAAARLQRDEWDARESELGASASGDDTEIDTDDEDSTPTPDLSYAGSSPALSTMSGRTVVGSTRGLGTVFKGALSGGGEVNWSKSAPHGGAEIRVVGHDEDVMHAALALCGLGVRR